MALIIDADDRASCVVVNPPPLSQSSFYAKIPSDRVVSHIVALNSKHWAGFADCALHFARRGALPTLLAPNALVPKLGSFELVDKIRPLVDGERLNVWGHGSSVGLPTYAGPRVVDRGKLFNSIRRFPDSGKVIVVAHGVPVIETQNAREVILDAWEKMLGD